MPHMTSRNLSKHDPFFSIVDGVLIVKIEKLPMGMYCDAAVHFLVYLHFFLTTLLHNYRVI